MAYAFEPIGRKTLTISEIERDLKMNWSEAFDEWYDEMFGNAQGEDSPYGYEDVSSAFHAGWMKKKSLSKTSPIATFYDYRKSKISFHPNSHREKIYQEVPQRK